MRPKPPLYLPTQYLIPLATANIVTMTSEICMALSGLVEEE